MTGLRDLPASTDAPTPPGAAHMPDVLGLPLDEAVAICQRAGLTPRILFTGEYRDRDERSPRVVAFRDGALIAAFFRAGPPKGAEDAP